MVIHRGEKAFDGTVAGLRERIGLPVELEVRFTREVKEYVVSPGPGGPPDAAPAVSLPRDVRAVWRNGRVCTLSFNRGVRTAMEMLRLVEQWGEIEDVRLKEPDFEDVVARVYQDPEVKGGVEAEVQG